MVTKNDAARFHSYAMACRRTPLMKLLVLPMRRPSFKSMDAREPIEKNTTGLSTQWTYKAFPSPMPKALYMNGSALEGLTKVVLPVELSKRRMCLEYVNECREQPFRRGNALFIDIIFIQCRDTKNRLSVSQGVPHRQPVKNVTQIVTTVTMTNFKGGRVRYTSTSLGSIMPSSASKSWQESGSGFL